MEVGCYPFLLSTVSYVHLKKLNQMSRGLNKMKMQWGYGLRENQ